MFSVKTFILSKIKLAKTPFLCSNYRMEQITIGTQILVGLRWLIVDSIDKNTGLLWCIDQDGGDHEIDQKRVAHIYRLGK